MSEQTYLFPWGKRIVRGTEVVDVHYEREERDYDHRPDSPDVSAAGIHPGDTATESAPDGPKPWWAGLNPTSVRRTF